MPRPRFRIADARHWAFDVALPYWAEHGVDHRDGGFVEHLTLDGRDAQAAFKRVRAQARQIYVFAHAGLLGWEEGRAIALRGWEFLTAHGRRDDGSWVRRMGRAGGVDDPTCDAYDLAFVLFAHAWMFRLTRDPMFHRSALETVDALDRCLAHPNGLGWHADESQAAPRQQNPHMHLIEAAIELADATGDERFVDMVRRIFDMFRERFFDRSAGVLREFYSDDWSRPAEDVGHIVEPGHMLEWSWILRRGERLLGLSVSDLPDLLYRRALALGERPDGLIVDQVDDRGGIVSANCRSWPQTEALKAHLAAFEAGDRDAAWKAARTLDHLLDRYLAYQPAGCWIDQLDDALEARIEKIPSTTFYHVFLAFSEIERLRPQLMEQQDAERGSTPV